MKSIEQIQSHIIFCLLLLTYASKSLVDLSNLTITSLLHHLHSQPKMILSSSLVTLFYMPVTPKSMSSSRTSLLNTVPFHQLPTWQLYLDISEASLTQHIQTRILHYSLILKYIALVPYFVANSSHPLNCLGQRLSRHINCSSFMSHTCQNSVNPVIFSYKIHLQINHSHQVHCYNSIFSV